MRLSLSNSSGVSLTGSGYMSTNEQIALTAFQRVKKYQRGQIITLALAFIFSTAACLTLSYVNFVWAPDCILFSTWIGRLTKSNPTTDALTSKLVNESLDADINLLTTAILGKQTGTPDPNKPVMELKEAVFGKKKNCYLTQYGYAAAAACGFILCWFFVFFRPTKEAYLFKKKTAASKLIIPGIVFCLAFTICVFVAAVTLQTGVSTWCDNIKFEPPLESCSGIQNYAIQYSSTTRIYVNFYPLLLVGQAFAWLASFIWLASLIILTMRCYLHIDFPDYFFDHSGSLNNDGYNTEDAEGE